MASSTHKQMCSICLDVYHKPKIIDCHHTFCLKCLQDMVANAGTSYFNCPLCNKNIRIPDGGVESFTSNFYIEDKTKADFCPNHQQKDIEFYCMDCCKAVCSKCFVSYHNGHDVSDLDRGNVRQEIRGILTTLRDELEHNIKRLQNNSDLLNDKLSEIQEYATMACYQVDVKVENVFDLIRSVGEEAKSEIRKSFHEDKQKLNTLMKDIETLNSELREIIKHAERVLHDESIVQVLEQIPKTKEAKICSDSITFAIPVVRYPLFKNIQLQDTEVTLRQLGTLEMFHEETFTSVIDMNRVMDDRDYNSPDHHSIQCMTWCVVARKGTEDLGLYFYLPEAANNGEDVYDVNYSMKLINHNNTCMSVRRQGYAALTSGGTPSGWEHFIDLEQLSHPMNGFIDSSNNLEVQVSLRIMKIENSLR